ncbi:restriction endonuclease subunit S [Aeribacillus alveayuensis]|uniref:Type I restriction enzyme S subunit n=1 Tax=Aeribacillus alveayuensis TaxID=279215 RepID=A0ABT9VTN2_9BACI|nr:type I restriction enzyme S subunit [Bacillus alveayuensis]
MSKKKQKSMEELLEEALVPEEEQPYKVPENWVWVRLGSVISSVKGKKPKELLETKESKSIPYVTIDYLTNGVTEETKYVPEQISKVRCNKEDILMVWDGARSGFVGRGGEGEVGSTLAKIEKRKFDTGYLYYFLKSKYEYINNNHRGTGIPHVNPEVLWNIPFPVSPLNEQKRIAHKIEQLFTKIDEAKRLIEEVKESFELRRAAILDKAFKGRLGTNDPNEKSMRETSDEIKEKDLIPKEEQPYEVPKNWVWVKLKSCLKRLQYGYTASSSTLEEGPKYLRITDIQNDSVDWETVPHCKIDADLLEKYKLNKGDIVIARTGATTGKSFLIDDVPSCSVFASYLIRLTTNDDLNPRYLWNYLKSPMYWKQITVVKKGIAQPGANAQIIGGLSVPLPPVHEQKRIADKVDILLSKLETEKEMVLEVEQKLDLLKQSILNKAFRGELGTNDPTEESAIELLKEVLKSK